MIPRAFLLAWSERAPWPDLRQVEQDLVICRALSDLFRSPDLRGRIAFRGGTAIHKLLLPAPLRYSEDIDLVQVHAGPIGPIIDAVRAALSWLGHCSREQAGHSMHLVFRFAPEVEPQSSLRLKVEINTREHGSLLGIREYPFTVHSGWHTAESVIASYEPEEIFGTKLRAFLQRRSGRDLFDLDHGLQRLKLDPARVIACFDHCLAQEGHPIRRAMAEERALEKLERSLTEDVAPMLPTSVRWDDAEAIRGFERVWTQLIGRIGGTPWKRSAQVIDELRSTRFPGLLAMHRAE